MLHLLRSFNKTDAITVSIVVFVSASIRILHDWAYVAKVLAATSGVMFVVGAIVYGICRFMLKMPRPGQSPTFLDVVRVLIIISASTGVAKGLVWFQSLQ